MKSGLLGRKVGMTQVFDEKGDAVPVTVVEAGPCVVLQVRTPEVDGYHALQLGFLDKKRRQAKRPERGHVQKANAEPKKLVREIRLDNAPQASRGDTLSVEVFAGVKSVNVQGISKGKGFQGVMKRHGFAGGRASHGVKRVHRSPGSIGMSATPSRVFRGMKMAGQMGVDKVTVKNLMVVKIDPENNLLLLKGAVPGHAGGYLTIWANS